MSDAMNAASGAPAGANAAAPAAAAPAAAPAPSDWTTGLNDDLKGYVQNKGFKDPGMALESYRNLEKLLGAPKERLLRLPEKDDAPEWGEVYGRLGRPEKAEDYKIQGDPDFVKWAQGTFHESGLSAKQAQALTEKYNKYVEGLQTQQQQNYEAKIQQEDAALKKEWGAAFDQNVNLAKSAAKTLGISGEQIDALEKAMGFAGVMKFMHGLGAKVGEDAFVSGGNKSSGFGALTPEAAMNRLTALKNDPTFVSKYIAGDAQARAEMEKLHRYAYPES